MTPFLSLMSRDLKLAMRIGGDTLTLVLFYVLVAVTIPLAVGPDKIFLARIAPGMIWIAAFLSTLLGLDRLFRADHEDGSLLAFRHAAIPMELIVFAKITVHWVTTGLPLILATPMLAVMLNLSPDAFWRLILSLVIGTPALTVLGAIGAAVTVSLRRGGLIAPVLILPLSMPILIFGVGSTDAASGVSQSALAFLAGISLLTLVFAPFAAALALRVSAE
jgi:heme exporter protein B